MADIRNSNLQETAGIRHTRDACVVLVRTEWNAFIVDELERGCRATLGEHGISRIETITVPGSFEIPFAVRTYWQHAKKKKRPDAFVALGTIIRGGTPHFDYVCKAITEGVLQLNLSLPVPVIFGVLTVDNEAQAKERIGGVHGHKGQEAALTALKMISLNQSFK